MTNKIKLPQSGNTVELKDSIGITVFRGYQKIIMKEAKINVENTKATQEIKVGLGSVYDGQNYILKKILLGIYDKDGSKLEPLMDKFDELSPADGNVVYAEIDKLIARMSMTPEAKKNGKKPV